MRASTHPWPPPFKDGSYSPPQGGQVRSTVTRPNRATPERYAAEEEL